MRFANFRDAGEQLDAAVRVACADADRRVWCPVTPNGVAVLAGIQTGDDAVEPLVAHRSTAGVDVAGADAAVIQGACVIVVDDGVETGTVARAVAAMLRELHPVRLVLAVPVCPREAEADLQHRYDAIVAVDRPLVRRDLRWHYRDMA